MLFALDLLYVLICLGAIVGGIALLAHLRGSHAHAPDCRPCRIINRLFRLP
ncbi:hypothetical protein ACWGA4_15645 [Streptomyces rubiginosohelvolus]|uniref:hypothetical protein n=1 Tax=Streptomyces sp. CB02130 TaxID=1703934 RepID=UPI000B0DB5C0|nr:hypothetical protein [Streptomyces sp. CB02130]